MLHTFNFAIIDCHNYHCLDKNRQTKRKHYNYDLDFHSKLITPIFVFQFCDGYYFHPSARHSTTCYLHHFLTVCYPYVSSGSNCVRPPTLKTHWGIYLFNKHVVTVKPYAKAHGYPAKLRNNIQWISCWADSKTTGFNRQAVIKRRKLHSIAGSISLQYLNEVKRIELAL